MVGTGTAIGDPTEADAISMVFRKHHSPEDPMYMYGHYHIFLSEPALPYSISSGASKSNIGQLEGDSGITDLIETIMVLGKEMIPPNATFERLNPKIDADFLNLRVRSLPLRTSQA